MRAAHTHLQKGFTLVELVIVIVLLSVLGVMTSSYIGIGVDLYTDITERDKELNSIRFVMERLRREAANALPNSAVVSDSVDIPDGCLTFTPIIASSIYGSDFPIAPVSADEATIAKMAVKINATSATRATSAVVYLLDHTELTGNKVWPIKKYKKDATMLKFKSVVSFPFSSPAKRVYIIRDDTTYCFSGTELYRKVNKGADILMAEDITGSFNVEDATLQRNGLVQAVFNLNFDGVEVQIEQTLHISNVP